MLCLLRDDVITALTACHRCALNRQVVAFASARRENDFAGRTANELSHALACGVHSFARRLAEDMAARWVPEMFRKVWCDCTGDVRINRSCPVVVEIDWRCS